MKHIPSPVRLAGNWMKYNLLKPLRAKPFLPRTLCYFVTHRCDNHCVMCGLWRQKNYDESAELTITELKDFLSDRLFSRMEHLDINGGEPTLKSDLPQRIESITHVCRRLKRITMSSNGLDADRVSMVKKIHNLCRKQKIKFSLAISLHGIGHELDRVTGTSNTFVKIKKTIGQLKALRTEPDFSLSLNCVITDVNADQLPAIKAWSDKENLAIHFALGEIRARFLNFDTSEKTLLGPEKKIPVIQFLRTLARNKRLTNPSGFRYHNLATMMDRSTPRRSACGYDLAGVIIGPGGQMFYCPHSREIGDMRTRAPYAIYFDPENLTYRRRTLKQDKCRSCPPYTFNELELQKDLHLYLRYLAGSNRS